MTITKNDDKISMFYNILDTRDHNQIKDIFNSLNTNTPEVNDYPIFIAISENPATPDDIRKKSKEIISKIQMERRKTAYLRLGNISHENGVKSRSFDIFPGHNKNSYSNYIPGSFDKTPEFLELKNEANKFAAGTKDLMLAYNLSVFVFENIKYNENWNKKDFVSLIENVKSREGVCKEQSLLLYFLLTANDIDAEFVEGYLIADNEAYRHTWVKIKIYNMSFLADPTHNIFEPYDSDFAKEHYLESNMLILRK